MFQNKINEISQGFEFIYAHIDNMVVISRGNRSETLKNWNRF